MKGGENMKSITIVISAKNDLSNSIINIEGVQINLSSQTSFDDRKDLIGILRDYYSKKIRSNHIRVDILNCHIE